MSIFSQPPPEAAARHQAFLAPSACHTADYTCNMHMHMTCNNMYMYMCMYMCMYMHMHMYMYG